MVGPANYVAHFSLNNYTVTATANPTVGGTVEGAGTYDQFTTCTLTATANESFQFKNWTVGGTVVSTSPTYTFEVSGPVEAIALFDLVQTTAMSNGWTWWSTCVELTGIDGLTMLENSLGDNGVMIKNSNAYVQNYSAYGLGWMGTENMVLSNEKGYKVNTNAACTATMVGSLANPADHPIEIQPQWNWIGYPVFQTQTVSSALAGFQPTANDIIKGQGDFSNYILGYGWLPEIILEPGKSYLYHSNNTGNQTLVFAESKNGTPVVETDNRHWRNDIYAYADNLCLIAVVSINEEEQRTENLELGAFVKGECRGSVRLKYVEPLDRYYAMMTITGESGDEIGFALIDETGNVISSEIGKNFAFINDAIVGSLDNPYRIDFGIMTSVEEHPMACLNVYPNPVNHGTAFNLLIPDDEIITDFVIVNMTGVEVRHERGALTRRTVAGLPTSGVYIVKVVCKSGRVYQSRLIVK